MVVHQNFKVPLVKLIFRNVTLGQVSEWSGCKKRADHLTTN